MWETAGASADLARRVGRDEHLDDLVGGPPQQGELVGGQCISNRDEPVSVEQGGGTLDIAGGDHLESGYPVALAESLTKGRDTGVVVGPRPGGTPGIARDEVAVLGGGLDVDITDTGRQTGRIVVRRGRASDRAVVVSVRRDVGVPAEGHLSRPRPAGRSRSGCPRPTRRAAPPSGRSVRGRAVPERSRDAVRLAAEHGRPLA